jgi:hypothetical protein
VWFWGVYICDLAVLVHSKRWRLVRGCFSYQVAVALVDERFNALPTCTPVSDA